MQKAIAVLLATTIAGCAPEPDAHSVAQTSGANAETAAPLPEEQEGGWILERGTSPMDGELVVASRMFTFDERDAFFVANVTCHVGSSELELVVQSFVGDANAPSEKSAIITDATGQPITQYTAQLSMYPKGRVKAGVRRVEDLSSYFRVDDAYRNYITFGVTNPLTTSLVDEAVGSPIGLEVFPRGAVNKAKVVLNALPMILEVENGAGKFELTVDVAAEVVSALTACGSDGDLLSQEHLSWIRQQMDAGEL